MLGQEARSLRQRRERRRAERGTASPAWAALRRAEVDGLRSMAPADARAAAGARCWRWRELAGVELTRRGGTDWLLRLDLGLGRTETLAATASVSVPGCEVVATLEQVAPGLLRS